MFQAKWVVSALRSVCKVSCLPRGKQACETFSARTTETVARWRNLKHNSHAPGEQLSVLTLHGV